MKVLRRNKQKRRVSAIQRIRIYLRLKQQRNSSSIYPNFRIVFDRDIRVQHNGDNKNN